MAASGSSGCCTCNGDRAKCRRCHCWKNGLPCSSCRPGERGACQNPLGPGPGPSSSLTRGHLPQDDLSTPDPDLRPSAPSAVEAAQSPLSSSVSSNLPPWLQSVGSRSHFSTMFQRLRVMFGLEFSPLLSRQWSLGPRIWRPGPSSSCSLNASSFSLPTGSVAGAMTFSLLSRKESGAGVMGTISHYGLQLWIAHLIPLFPPPALPSLKLARLVVQ